MSQQYQEMYDYNQNRSPGSTRGYGGNNALLNRQPSRHFSDNYGPPQQLQSGLYTAEDYAMRQEGPPRYDRMASATVHSNFQYDNQTWNYSGHNGVGANIMGGTGRAKPSARRAGLPSVSNPSRVVFTAVC